MKALVAASFCVCFIALWKPELCSDNKSIRCVQGCTKEDIFSTIDVVSAEECDYTMKKMCEILAPNATYNERGCWYTCRIKAEFEVFSGTKVNGLPCKSIVGNVDGVCKHGLCWPNQ